MRRRLAIALCASALIGGCGKKDGAEQQSGSAQNVSAQSFDSKDATSIDAATGADANFAEDVELTLNDLDDANLDADEDLNTAGSNAD
jgi:hypothetical protein